MITSRLFIKPEYKLNVIGVNECILKIYRETFHIDVFFESVNGELVMKGSKEGVKWCREDVEYTLATLRWWHKEDEEAVPAEVPAGQGTECGKQQTLGHKKFETVETSTTKIENVVIKSVSIEAKY